MCLQTTHYFAKTAKKDIEVYKKCSVVLVEKATETKNEKIALYGHFFENHWYSLRETATFKKRKTSQHFVEVGWFYKHFRWDIENGLHAKRESTGFSNTVWRIPKGAKYYVGTNGDIVSDELIFLRFKSVHDYPKSDILWCADNFLL